MPLRDGTGPFGLGLGSGRKRGGCRSGIGNQSISRSLFRGKQGLFAGVVVPLAAAVVRDLLNPSGVLRRIAHALPTRKISNNAPNAKRDAGYSIIGENSAEPSGKLTKHEQPFKIGSINRT